MEDSVFKGTIIIKEKFFEKFNNILKEAKKKLEENGEDSKELKLELEDLQFFDAKKLALWIRAHYFSKVYNCEPKLGFKDYFKKEENKTKCPIKLGKHTGAVSKTISGLREIKVKGKTEPQDSQTSFWYINNKPMGWVIAEII